jgi:hypothetical protein
VKNDGECCIADLGLAVKYDSQKNIIDLPGKKFIRKTYLYLLRVTLWVAIGTLIKT